MIRLYYFRNYPVISWRSPVWVCGSSSRVSPEITSRLKRDQSTEGYQTFHRNKRGQIFENLSNSTAVEVGVSKTKKIWTGR